MIQLVSSEQTIVRRVKVDIDLSETVDEFRKLLRSPLRKQPDESTRPKRHRNLRPGL
jgi:hypothetical protein